MLGHSDIMHGLFIFYFFYIAGDPQAGMLGHSDIMHGPFSYCRYCILCIWPFFFLVKNIFIIYFKKKYIACDPQAGMLGHSDIMHGHFSYCRWSTSWNARSQGCYSWAILLLQVILNWIARAQWYYAWPLILFHCFIYFLLQVIHKLECSCTGMLFMGYFLIAGDSKLDC